VESNVPVSENEKIENNCDKVMNEDENMSQDSPNIEEEMKGSPQKEAKNTPQKLTNDELLKDVKIEPEEEKENLTETKIKPKPKTEISKDKPMEDASNKQHTPKPKLEPRSTIPPPKSKGKLMIPTVTQKDFSKSVILEYTRSSNELKVIVK
jgi:hypothetical protein